MINNIILSLKPATPISTPLYTQGSDSVKSRLNMYYERDKNYPVNYKSGYRVIDYLLPEGEELDRYMNMNNIELITAIEEDYIFAQEHFDHITSGRVFENYFSAGPNDAQEIVVRTSLANPLSTLSSNIPVEQQLQQLVPFQLLYSDSMILTSSFFNLKIDRGDINASVLIFGLDVTAIIVLYIKYLKQHKDDTIQPSKHHYITRGILFNMLRDSTELWSVNLLNELVLTPSYDYLKHVVNKSSNTNAIVTHQFNNGLKELSIIVGDLKYGKYRINRLYNTPLTILHNNSLFKFTELRNNYSYIPNTIQYKGIKFLADYTLYKIYINSIKLTTQDIDLSSTNKRDLKKLYTYLKVTDRLNSTRHIRSKQIRTYAKVLMEDIITSLEELISK